MIPSTRSLAAPPSLVARFVQAVQAAGFSGEASATAADRLAIATDNSVYQVAPDAILFPRSRADLACIARTLAEPAFHAVALRPRGGGTATTGASLGAGVTVDLSRFMTAILEINAAEGWVRVEPGVVKDQLNAVLRPHGMFFAPELAPSNRATLGGMISTDACGQGSVLYGKTSDHVLALDIVLADGTTWCSRPLAPAALAAVQARDDMVGAVHQVVDQVQRENAALIAERFPRLNRSLTGYDLAHIRDGQGRFDLNAVLCGSEGTLALIAEATLRVLPIPAASRLVAVRYASFDAALRDAEALKSFRPASIETVDTMVLNLAKNDNIWSAVGAYFPEDAAAPLHGINLVQFVGDDAARVAAAAAQMTAALDVDPGATRLGYTVATGDGVAQIWDMRKRAVGLLGNGPGRARPVAFIEDCAVPPERLADFVAEFRAVLDSHRLEYGMYGHVDAGVLHVRPALDLTDPAHEALIRELSETVAGLADKYGGLLWGEHGKGVRSEFVPAVFGPLYPCLVAIKRAFDPRDQLNPGKIASSLGHDLLKVDGVALRGGYDRDIPEAVRPHYDGVLSCNGNGACFNYDLDDPMCPSWKATRERRHSPKGRAGLIREWLRLLAAAGVDPVAEAVRIRRAGWLGAWRRWARPRDDADFAHEVKAALDGCLGCNACSGQCPVKVSIPNFRAKFFELYYDRYRRPLRDYVVGGLERVLPRLARVPRLANALLGSRLARAASGRLGLVDTPRLSRGLGEGLARRGVAWATPARLAALDQDARRRSVVIVQDAMTSHFEAELVLDVVELVRALGFTPYVAPYRPAGTPLHVLGFLGRFAKVAARNGRHLRALQDTGVDLVGIDPAMTLPYRTEYRHVLEGGAPKVQLLQEWLASRIEALPQRRMAGRAQLLPHCTERATALASLADWTAVFRRCGVALSVVPVGCCGMAGQYGHETEHLALSRQIYDASWARHVDGATMASGYSCRAQAERFGGVKLRHPAQVLLAALT